MGLTETERLQLPVKHFNLGRGEKMKKRYEKRYIIAGIAALTLFLSACRTNKLPAETTGTGQSFPTDTIAGSQKEEPEKTVTEGSKQSGQGKGEREQSGETAPGSGSYGDDQQDCSDMIAESDRIHAQVLDDLGLDGTLLSEPFCKAGDRNQMLSVYISDGTVSSNRLSLNFYGDFLTDEDAPGAAVQAEIETEPGKTVYHGAIESASGYDTETCEITFYREGNTGFICISVKGDERISGNYYPSSSYSYPDIFHRYLSRADLWLYPTEDLWLLRNEIYAAHGRIFNNEILSQYFIQKPWYRENVKPVDFSESVFSDVEKKNILLIQSLENDSGRRVVDGKMYGIEDFPIAPYLSYLTEDRETGLSLDLSDSTDLGAYYVIHGRIMHPVTVSQKELDIVKSGGTTEVIVNDLTKEAEVFQLNTRPEKSRYSRYLLYKADTSPDETGGEVSIRPNYQTGLYELWQDSDDTIMKVVYEGDIFVMKGAVTGSHVAITEASRDQKEIIPDDQNVLREIPGVLDHNLYGNCLRHNGRGIITAVYYLGD